MLKRWKKIESKEIFKNPWWTYKLDNFEIPNGVTGEYHYVHTNGSSMVIPVTQEGKIILVNQYRYLCDKESLEFPCGSVKDGSSYTETAHLELQEETGYKAKKIEFAGEFNPYNGVASEICKVYIAKDLKRALTKPDETEEFEVLHFSPEEIDILISENRIWDGMTLAAWLLSRKDVMKKLNL